MFLLVDDIIDTLILFIIGLKKVTADQKTKNRTDKSSVVPATAIKEKPIEFPVKSQYGFLIPEWLKNSIAICVAKKPSARFANAHELYNAFSKKRVDNAGKIRSAIKV